MELQKYLKGIVQSGETSISTVKKQELYQEILNPPMDFDTFSFLIDLSFENQQQKQAWQKQKKIMDEHVHNCKNITFPKIIFQVAKELSRGETERDKRLAQDLMYAYVAQTRMDTDTKLLKLKVETSKSGDFLAELQKFMGGKNTCKVDYLAKECLMLTLYRILMTQEELLDQEEYALSQEKTMDSLKKSFLQETITPSGGKFDVIHWFSHEIYEFHLDLTDVWNEVSFQKQGCAFVYLGQIITNLMINALNYGVKSKNGKITLLFSEKIMDGQEYLMIFIANPVERESSFLQSTGYGIDSVKEAVARLNETENLELFTTITAENQHFSVEIAIQKSALTGGQQP